MDFFVVARSGEHGQEEDGTGGLTQLGRRQSRSLAREISAGLVHNGIESALLMHAQFGGLFYTARQETAKLIAREVGIPEGEIQILVSAAPDQTDIEFGVLFELLKSRRCAILVTSSEHAGPMVDEASERLLGEIVVRTPRLNPGQAYILELGRRRCRLMRPSLAPYF